ncbi:MAG: energy-coupling factor transporter ATPase [Alicyclobacillus sp.]|nr:energy-coupling factor transporter ATPase [Alicyclobacillus sp.]
MKPLIEVNQISFSYGQGPSQSVAAFTDVSLRVYPGEYVAVIGQNGSGKSTLAKHLNGILTPTRGDVWVAGMNTKDASCKQQIRRCVGMVFQSPDNQLVATIVEDDVAFGLENLGVPPGEMQERIDEALEAVGMSEYRHRPPHFLSGGQKQRVAIAGILAMRPDCLVLDEATSMLDSFGRAEILAVVRRLNQQGMAIVTITHHMSEVAEADRVLVMHEGRVALEGTPRELFAHPDQLEALGLDVPEASRVAQQVHARIPAFRRDAISVEEVVAEVDRLAGSGGERRHG